MSNNVIDITKINMFDKDTILTGYLNNSVGSQYAPRGVIGDEINYFYSKLIPVKLNDEIWFYSDPIGSSATHVYQYNKDLKLIKYNTQKNGKINITSNDVSFVAMSGTQYYINSTMISFQPLDRYYPYSSTSVIEDDNLFNNSLCIDKYTFANYYDGMYPYISNKYMKISPVLSLKNKNLSYINDTMVNLEITLFKQNGSFGKVVTLKPESNGTVDCTGFNYFNYTISNTLEKYDIWLVLGNIIPLPRYVKQIWSAYDETKPEVLQPNSVLSSDRMNHIEGGIKNIDTYAHSACEELDLNTKEALTKLEEQTKLVNSAMIDINLALESTTKFTEELDDARTDSSGNKQPTLGDSIRGQIQTRGNVLDYLNNKLQLRSGSKILSEIEFTAATIGALPNTTVIPSKNSELQNDSNFTTLEAVKAYITESGGTGGGSGGGGTITEETGEFEFSSSGWTTKLNNIKKYGKIVQIAVSSLSGSGLSSKATIGTIPVPFRPLQPCVYAGIIRDLYDSRTYSATYTIDTDGVVIVDCGSLSNMRWVHINFMYII